MQQVFTKIKFAKIQFLLMASIVFIVLPSALHAQEVRLETTLDKNEIQIVDHLVYKNTLIFKLSTKPVLIIAIVRHLALFLF